MTRTVKDCLEETRAMTTALVQARHLRRNRIVLATAKEMVRGRADKADIMRFVLRHFQYRDSVKHTESTNATWTTEEQMRSLKRKERQAEKNFMRQDRREVEGKAVRVPASFWAQVANDYRRQMRDVLKRYLVAR